MTQRHGHSKDEKVKAVPGWGGGGFSGMRVVNMATSLGGLLPLIPDSWACSWPGLHPVLEPRVSHHVEPLSLWGEGGEGRGGEGAHVHVSQWTPPDTRHSFLNSEIKQQ